MRELEAESRRHRGARRAWPGLALALLAAALAAAPRAAERAGDFNHYVLALSWNAAWCAAEGDARAAPQCRPAGGLGFVLHGLWPQRATDWPEYCTTDARDPSRRETGAMADIMGSPGLAWYQWKKHGRCSGLDPAAYFELARRAWESIRRPAVLRQLDRPLRVAPGVIEDAFIEANPGLSRDGVTVICRDGDFREVRICLGKDLAPRNCSGRAARDCPAAGIDLLPMR